MSKKVIVVITGENKEVFKTRRIIDYGDRQAQYYLLRPNYERLGDETVIRLTEGIENIGYNFRQIQDWFRQSGVRQHMISEELADTKLYEIFDEEYAGELDNDERGETEIEKRLSHFQDIVSPRSGTPTEKMLDYLCDYYLISRDLLYKGQGEIYEVTESYYDDFMNSVDDLVRDGFDPDTFTTLEVVKAYATKRNLELKEVLTTKYAIIEHSGSYQILNSKKYAPQKSAVDNLMDTLWGFMNP